MTASFDVQFGGIDALIFDLSTAGPRTQAQGEQALDKAGNDVIAIARRLVPVDTSATQNSIGMDRPAPLVRVVGPTTGYAIHLELGTSRMPPFAFMGPAGDIVAPRLSDAMAQLGAAAVSRPGGL